MNKFIISPFYSILDNKLLYLGKHEICKLPLEEDIKNDILINEGAIFEINRVYEQDKTVLVLEPHPDDFVLSALGYILNRYNTIVGNIFSKTDINSFTWKDNININEKEYERLRIEESILAVEKILKQQFVTLKEESVRITKKTKQYVEEKILKFIKEILHKNNHIDTLLIPMGIGNHPDHIIVHDTVIKNEIINNRRIILYPEYPYARCKKSYNDRLKELKKKYKLKKIIVDVEDKIDIMSNAIAAYRSQFDDINRNQMLAIIREDFRALAQENKKEKDILVYYEVKEIKNEN